MARAHLSLWTPRRGSDEREYEDCAAGDAERGRYAIADGATESSFAGEWARLLVEGFVRGPTAGAKKWSTWLEDVQARWREQIGAPELPWFAEQMFERGAFAAFLGLTLHEDGAWRAFAVGDCCLFHVRSGRLKFAFPLTQASAFGNTPDLIGSRTPPEQLAAQSVVLSAKGRCRPGDGLWLMTDALAQWFLAQHESDRRPIDAVDAIVQSDDNARFVEWVTQLRRERSLRNDHATLLAVRV